MDFNKFTLRVIEVLHEKFGIDFVVCDGRIKGVIYHE